MRPLAIAATAGGVTAALGIPAFILADRPSSDAGSAKHSLPVAAMGIAALTAGGAAASGVLGTRARPAGIGILAGLGLAAATFGVTELLASEPTVRGTVKTMDKPDNISKVQDQANGMQERIEGPGPAGGAYQIARYFDDSGTAVPKPEATRMMITEYDADGTRLAEQHGVVKP